MATKDEIVAELRRVATKLGTNTLSGPSYSQNGKISRFTIRNVFGSWKRAVEAAGLKCIAARTIVPRPRLEDDELLREIIRLTQQLGKEPSYNEMGALGRFSTRPYRKRWGSFPKAREEAYHRFGFPKSQGIEAQTSTGEPQPPPEPRPTRLVPSTIQPKGPRLRSKIQFGEPINFRGLRFAPINEQGVVYLFGMISNKLGFLIESVRTDYPDCEGKRCVDAKDKRWEQVFIEFEFRSSGFLNHGHDPERCDVIVCWIHDWDDCPLEVVELRSIISTLA